MFRKSLIIVEYRGGAWKIHTMPREGRGREAGEQNPLPFSNKELSEQKVDELQAVKDFTVRLPFYYADKSRRIQEV